MLTTIERQAKLSFVLGGVPFEEHHPTVRVQEDEHRIRTTYTFDGGLRVTNTLRLYPEYGACDMVNEWENVGDAPTDIISALSDADVLLPLPPCAPKTTGGAYLPTADNVIKLVAPRGSDWSESEFTCDVDRLLGNRHPYWFERVGESKQFFAVGGRSSDQTSAPFFNVIHPTAACGYVAAIGWTGEWQADLTRTEEGIRLQACVKDARFRILPGERFRTASLTLLSYRGTPQDGQNKWRRFVRAHYAPIGRRGVPSEAPFCAGLWGGMSSQGCVERIRTVEREALPFDHFWMDAGWYGAGTQISPDEYEGDWAQHTGNWEINAARHPDGLCDVVREIDASGKRFILWFEPERVHRDTPIASEHPEYLLFLDEKDPNTLLNLGNEQAWQYCFDTLSALIERLHVSVYRQDFNFRPLPYWQANDTDDRRGMTEILHINGLYRLWDALLDRFPALLIDNCASGGRRIDVETLRRSVPLWRSDAQCPADPVPEMAQCHALSHGAWMPYSGTGTGRVWFDTYRFRSAYAPAMTTNFTFSEKNTFGDDAEGMAWLHRMCDEYLRVRPYLSKDIYPLTTPTAALDAWSAVQYHDAEADAGVLQVFRRERSPYETATFALCGLDPSAHYAFEDTDGGSFTADGATLTEQGLTLRVVGKRVAKVYFYKKL